MAISTRDGLKQYALRALGSPVIEINVDDDQLEDRIDEALEYWRLYHSEGIEQLYAKYLITASTLNLTTNNAQDFKDGIKITGAVSGATAYVKLNEGTTPESRTTADNLLLIINVTGTFLDGETVSGGTTTATLAATNSFYRGVYDNKYITLSDLIYGVTRVIPLSQASSSKNIFDLQYQLRLHDLYDISSTSMIYYKTMMQHISMLDMELNSKPDIRFNRLTNKLYLDIKWSQEAHIGQYIIIDGYGALDPASAPKLWNELWLKHYTTALFKKQWAINIKKFSGIQLPGGVTLDGESLYQEATGEIKDLEDELMTKSAPLSWFVG